MGFPKLFMSHNNKQSVIEFGFVSPRKPMHKPKPPDTKALEAARKQRLKEIQMWSVIREILFYAFFLWILLVISYRNVSTDSYNYKHNMQKVFILTNDTNKAFSKVNVFFLFLFTNSMFYYVCINHFFYFHIPLSAN
jgi:hypothetical protein